MDDPFLPSILASPGDDAPRLVYADWLDERGDPRGAYLRAERDACNSARSPEQLAAASPRLARLAEGLDPVWVARVSRLPFGVCCDRVRFKEFGNTQRPRLQPSAFNLMESWLGTELPPAYKAFLLNENGGAPEPGRFSLPGGLTRDVNWLQSIWSPDGASTDLDLDLVCDAELHLLGMPPHLPPGIGIAPDCIKIGVCVITGQGDTICLGYKGERRGRVVLADMPEPGHSVGAEVPIADDFPSFLAMLHAPEKK